MNESSTLAGAGAFCAVPDVVFLMIYYGKTYFPGLDAFFLLKLLNKYQVDT